MSEEKRKLSAFEAFAQTQLTFAEAEEKAKQEAGAPRVERFRIGEDGEYPIRVLPLAPSFDADGNILPMDRKGYECPVRQQFIAIEVPAKKGGKVRKINIPVIQSTMKEVGYSVDLIDTYVKIAKELYGDDEDLIKIITDNNYSGGLRWNYQHAMFVLDTSSDKERAKGPQLFQCSHSQYKAIDDAKMRLWKELMEDGEQKFCPISWFTDAYPVKIIRGTNNGKTEYTIEIGRKHCDVKEAEVEKLLDLPRIPEQIYRFTRYQFEAIQVFLKQYDEKHDMEVCKEPDFIEAVEKLKGELPADDNSHFDLAGAASKGSESEEVTLDSLYRDYDAIIDQDLNEKSDEYQDLREKIRQYIEDKGLDVRISRTKNNQQLLQEIEEAMESQAKGGAKPAEVEEAPAKRSPRPKADEPEDSDDDSADNADEAEEAPRARRPRPGSEPEEAPNTVEVVEDSADKAEAPAEDEAPRRRRRLR